MQNSKLVVGEIIKFCIHSAVNHPWCLSMLFHQWGLLWLGLTICCTHYNKDFPSAMSNLVQNDFVITAIIGNVMNVSVIEPTICICENKDADQLRGDREADQRLCFRYTDTTLPLLFKSEISSFQPASVTVQPDFCRTCSETTLLVFPTRRLNYRKIQSNSSTIL